MDRRTREVKKMAARYGLEVVPTRGGHLGLRRDGALLAVTSMTASDWRSLKNLESVIKRATS